MKSLRSDDACFADGEIVWCYYLHKDQAREIVGTAGAECRFEVPAKGRYALVLGQVKRPYRTGWYRLLKLTRAKSMRPEDRKRLRCLGRLINEELTYAVLEPEPYPENLLRKSRQPSVVPLEYLRRMVVAPILKDLTISLLKSSCPKKL